MGVNRLNDLSAIEARLLELAHTTDARITAATLAYFAPSSVENAQKVLDDLSARNQLSMDVEDDGSITYELLGRQRLTPTRALAPLHREVELAPARPARSPSPVIAALLSTWIPGAGQLYAGRFAAAIAWFLVVGAGYVLFLPGLFLHLLCIVSAATSSARRRLEAPTSLLYVPRYRQLAAAPGLQQ